MLCTDNYSPDFFEEIHSYTRSHQGWFLRPYKWFLSPYFKWVPKINISITVLQRRFDSASSFISVAHFYLIVRRKTTTSYVKNTKDLYTGTDLEKANHTTLAWYGCFQRSFNSFSLSDFSLRLLERPQDEFLSFVFFPSQATRLWCVPHPEYTRNRALNISTYIRRAVENFEMDNSLKWALFIEVSGQIASDTLWK